MNPVERTSSVPCIITPATIVHTKMYKVVKKLTQDGVDACSESESDDEDSGSFVKICHNVAF